MKSILIRINEDIGLEIRRIAEVLDISSSQASCIVFLKGDFKKWGRPKNHNAEWWNRSFPEAKVLYRRKKLANRVLNTL